jgi:dUTP pyrophosphatase
MEESLIASIRTRDSRIEIPLRANNTDIGYDIKCPESISLEMGEYAIIDTGLIVKPPEGYHFEVILRSSTPKKHGVIIPISVGLIDPTYCGPEDFIKVILFKCMRVPSDVVINTGREKGNRNIVYNDITTGERIAQLILRKSYTFDWKDDTGTPFEETSRGGIGSTGK